MTGIRGGSCNPSYWEDFVSVYSYHMSVHTGLPDHTMQTKFQSQRPNDVEIPVPSIWAHKLSSIGTAQYLDGWPPYGFVWGYSYPISVRTGLPDYTKQTKFQMLKHLFPLFEYRSFSSIGTVSTWMGDHLMCLWFCYLHGKKADQLLATGVESHQEELIQCIALHSQWRVHLYAMTEG
jgi:hypothetical protein